MIWSKLCTRKCHKSIVTYASSCSFNYFCDLAVTLSPLRAITQFKMHYSPELEVESLTVKVRKEEMHKEEEEMNTSKKENNRGFFGENSIIK